MKVLWEHKGFSIPVMIFLLIGIVLVLVVPYGNEVLFFNDLRKEPLVSLFKFFSWCGETWIWIICGLAALFWRFRFTLIIAATGLLMPLVFILKDQAAVDRPATYFQKENKFQELVVVPGIFLNRGQTSFPSGHTMAAFGLFTTLTLMAGKKRKGATTLFAVLAIGAGVSRVFLAQHFLIDVLGGAVLGMLVSTFVWQLNESKLIGKNQLLDGRIKWPAKSPGA